MEFSFDIPRWFDIVLEKPELMVFWAAFGMFFFMCIFLLIGGGINKIVKSKRIERLLTLTATAFGVTWLSGFVLMICLFFAGVSGIKLLLIWMLLLITTLTFCFVEHGMVLKLMSSIASDPEKAKKESVKRRRR